jgi:hypothetical protein
MSTNVIFYQLQAACSFSSFKGTRSSHQPLAISAFKPSKRLQRDHKTALVNHHQSNRPSQKIETKKKELSRYYYLIYHDHYKKS